MITSKKFFKEKVLPDDGFAAIYLINKHAAVVSGLEFVASTVRTSGNLALPCKALICLHIYLIYNVQQMLCLLHGQYRFLFACRPT